MFDILFFRTFMIVGAMLVITALTSRVNKHFETKGEMWATIAGTFAFLFSIIFFADIFPLNLVLVGIFSALMGWQIGPAITSVGLRYKQRKVKMSGSDVSAYELEWKNIVTEALVATAIAVIATASLVFLTNINFSFLGGFLFIALIILILMSLANLLLFKSRLVSLARAYLGVVVFTLYLLYDFNRLEKMAGDDSWGAAVDIAVNIYLDIINLFLQLLEILAETSD